MRSKFVFLLAIALSGLLLSQRVVAESSTRGHQASQPTPSFKPDLLRLRFRRTDESARLAELASIRRHHLDHEELPGALADSISFNLERRRISGSVLEAVRLFCQLDEPALADQQLALLTGKNTDVSVAVVGASELARRKIPEALEVLVQLSRSPDFARSFGMRRAVVDAASNYPTPDAVEFLIEILTRQEGLLRYETARHLKSLTKQNFGGYPQHWQDWWSANKAGVEFEPAVLANTNTEQKTGESQAMPWPQIVPKFFGQLIYGKRVLFVIDRSRSMLSSVDGVTRNEEVQEELETVIDELPEGTFFNLIAYEEERQLWATELVESTVEARSDAVRFVYSLLPQNKTALYDALEDALRHDENIEQIVLLSDGKPTAGRVVIPGAIVELITRQNAFSQTTIDAVGIDTRGDEELFLEQLTSRNFGKLRVIR